MTETNLEYLKKAFEKSDFHNQPYACHMKTLTPLKITKFKLIHENYSKFYKVSIIDMFDILKIKYNLPDVDYEEIINEINWKSLYDPNKYMIKPIDTSIYKSYKNQQHDLVRVFQLTQDQYNELHSEDGNLFPNLHSLHFNNLYLLPIKEVSYMEFHNIFDHFCCIFQYKQEYDFNKQFIKDYNNNNLDGFCDYMGTDKFTELEKQKINDFLAQELDVTYIKNIWNKKWGLLPKEGISTTFDYSERVFS